MEYPKDALTLHLYRYDEVLASLEWSIVNKAHTEAVFWGLELYDSDMLAETPELLGKIWTQHIGFCKSGARILEQILAMQSCKALDRDDWIHSLYTWSRIQNMDSTVISLIIRGCIMPTDWQPQFPHKQEFTTIESAFVDCLNRGKLKEAWLISRALEPETQWELIENAATRMGRLETLKLIKSLKCNSDTLKRGSACVLIILTDELLGEAYKESNTSAFPSELIAAIEEWDAEQSLKKRRTLKVRPEAITYVCQRSYLPVVASSSNEIECNFETTLKKSPYWIDVLSNYQTGGKWKSESYKEMFYDTYFNPLVDDIPDEWSLKAKEQSHGRGLGKSEEVALEHYINGMLRNRLCLAYGIEIKRISRCSVKSLNWSEQYTEMLVTCSRYLEAQLPLKPIAKDFILA